MPMLIAREENFLPPASPEQEAQQQALREGAMILMATAWQKLVQANSKDAADKVEREGNAIFGEQAFGEAMVETIQNA